MEGCLEHLHLLACPIDVQVSDFDVALVVGVDDVQSVQSGHVEESTIIEGR